MSSALALRADQDAYDSQPSAKRGKYEITPALESALQMVNIADRKTGLAAPTIRLTGHNLGVHSIDFSPDGKHLASSSSDRKVLLWNVYGDCENYGVLDGHQNAVLDVKWSYDGDRLFTCSADKTVAIWDSHTGERVRKYGANHGGHTAIINGIGRSRRGAHMLCSAGDDGATKIWDTRVKRCVGTFEHQYQILACCFDDATEKVFAGSLDNTVRVYDMRKLPPPGAADDLDNLDDEPDYEAYVLEGHFDSVTGLDLSPDGEKLITNSMDQTLRLWDVRAVASNASSRLLQTFDQPGAVVHSSREKNLLRVRWNADGNRVCAASADKTITVYDVGTKEILYKLPGHMGSVNDGCFSPTEPDILASCSEDRTIYLGELA